MPAKVTPDPGPELDPLPPPFPNPGTGATPPVPASMGENPEMTDTGGCPGPEVGVEVGVGGWPGSGNWFGVEAAILTGWLRVWEIGQVVS